MPENESSPTSSAGAGSCPDCGAPASGGRAGCQALFDELAAQAFTDLRYAPVYMLAFDTYCMQHPNTYCRSAKSYAAHLTRLCCGLEHTGSPEIYAAIQRWLSGTVDIEKPATLSHRGSMTVADMRAARNVEDHKRLVRDWARSVWEAYAPQHEIARNWIEAALLPTSYSHLLKRTDR
ncbi:MAG: DUF5946 family protein [Anaerolineae bacterium]